MAAGVFAFLTAGLALSVTEGARRLLAGGLVGFSVFLLFVVFVIIILPAVLIIPTVLAVRLSGFLSLIVCGSIPLLVSTIVSIGGVLV